ncbi:hypothetical protein KAR91_16480, partial [Candidatus Pacearchaeota archaeon]|nr:hypothetical protein [Candidatus Pacearchaeota archaeon]
MSSETREIDRGYKELKKQLKNLHGSSVTIGVHEGAGQYPADEAGNSPHISEVAIKNEFGGGHIPERSFMRSTLDENKEDHNTQRKKMKAGVLSGEITVNKALNKMGFRVQEQIRGKIETLRTPPNAPMTIALKPEIGDNPLIDSRLLKRSINYEVHD